tara:strand:+ start:63 stop:329 length:267 start_codon:yes stop_codon:yes gene_type:complete
MSEEKQIKEFNAYKKALINHDWEDSDSSFYEWVDIEAKHDISPDSEYLKEFQEIWTGKAENFSKKMNILEWERQRSFYRNLCAYGKLW